MNDEEELLSEYDRRSYTNGASLSAKSDSCYLRMAKCALRAMEFGRVEPVLIRRLWAAPGCELRLFGTASAYTLRCSRTPSPARVGADTFFPLDSKLTRARLRTHQPVMMNPKLGTTSRRDDLARRRIWKRRIARVAKFAMTCAMPTAGRRGNEREPLDNARRVRRNRALNRSR